MTASLLQDPDTDEEQEVDLEIGVYRRRYQDLYADTAYNGEIC